MQIIARLEAGEAIGKLSRLQNVSCVDGLDPSPQKPRERKENSAPVLPAINTHITMKDFLQYLCIGCE